MKKYLPPFVIVLFFYAAVSSVGAADVATLDKVTVLMPKAKVLSLLGNPQETMTLARGLKVEVYSVEAALPLTHWGCIYDQDGLLMGQSFVFQGRAAGQIAERLEKHGFTPLAVEGNLRRFAGLDDDTGRPLVAVIAAEDNLTTVTTFEKAFYDTHVR